MKTIKKAQSGTTVKDKTAVVKPKRKPTTVRNEPKYIDPITKEKVKLKTAKDSIEYKKGSNSPFQNASDIWDERSKSFPT